MTTHTDTNTASFKRPYTNDPARKHFEWYAHRFNLFLLYPNVEAFAPRSIFRDHAYVPDAIAPLRRLHELIAKCAEFMANRATDRAELLEHVNYAMGLVMAAELATSHAHASGFGAETLRNDWINAARRMTKWAETCAIERLEGGAA